MFIRLATGYQIVSRLEGEGGQAAPRFWSDSGKVPIGTSGNDNRFVTVEVVNLFNILPS